MKDAVARREDLRLRLQRASRRLDADGWLTGDEGHERAEAAAKALTPAAVLVGLVARTAGPHVVLTKRTPHLADHAGEISLPGGRIEDHDAGPAAAALREAFEEIGLAPDKVQLLGGLRPYDTISGFRVHPVVGWIEPPVAFLPDPFEVAEVFEVPLGFLLDAANHRRDSLMHNGERRHFFVLPYRDRYIWGATAGILVNFARLLTE